MAAFRNDIQALRAVAVCLVVIYHVWPAFLTGGFIGVDVFFVISGYLITGHLVQEVLRTGHVDLPCFYARRAQRLLPAASLTVVGVGLASYVWMPASTWHTIASDMVASTFYAENWVLVRRSVDYLAHDTTPSPLQHFWSLAVEEQFYFVWPLLVSGVVLVWKARFRAYYIASTFDANKSAQTVRDCSPGRVQELPPARWAYAAPMGFFSVASFVTAIYYARVNPAPGYFMTHVRLYELGLGGLLGVWAAGRTPDASRLPPISIDGRPDTEAGFMCKRCFHSFNARTVGAVLGLVGIAGPAFLYTPHLPFPGIAAAIPVLATTLVIASGEVSATDTHPHALSWVLAHPWLQYIGNVSYSLYLAHWPVVVLYPFVTGKDVSASTADGAFVLLLSFALTHACYVGWEHRFRSTRSWEYDQDVSKNASSLPKSFDSVRGKHANEARPTDACEAYGMSENRRKNLRSAAIMAFLMGCATLSSSVFLYTFAQNTSNEAERNEYDNVPANATDTSAPKLSLPLPAELHLCPKLYGTNSSTTHPGADVVFYRCSELNSLAASEALPRLGVATTEYTCSDHPAEMSWSPPNSTAPRGHIMLMGDSQARMSWGPAVSAIAQRMGFKFTNLGRNACPPSLTPARLYEASASLPVDYGCRDWVKECLDRVLHEKPSVLVIVAADRYTTAGTNSSGVSVADGVVQVVQPAAAHGIPVVGIKATPHLGGSVPSCLMQELRRNKLRPNVISCNGVSNEVLRESCVEAATKAYPVMSLLSFDDLFCPNATCPPIIGNVVVYRDELHLTTAFSKSLANVLQDKMLAVVPHLKRLASTK